MCVIMMATGGIRPTEDMVGRAYDANDDGAGAAWRETNAAGVKEVVWKKDLDLEGIQHICATAPLTYIAHFRVASIGGVRADLTHPFPITKKAELDLEGRTKGYVLFHNGHWKQWSEVALDAAVKSNTHIPSGRWSDTRAMAWLCSIYGNGFMEFLSEHKGVAFGPHALEIYQGTGWKKINDVWCSNDYFMTKSRKFDYNHNPGAFSMRMCGFTTCRSKDLVEGTNYCKEHPGGRMIPPDDAKVVATPFPKIAQGQIISLEVAERLHKDNKLSKSRLKKIRKHWETESKRETKARLQRINASGPVH